MRRGGLWLRWSARDLRSRGTVVAAIALVIAIGTGLYTALGSMESWRKQSNDASFRLLHAHALRVSLTEGTYAPAGRLLAGLRSIPDAGSVRAAEERLVVPTQVEAAARGRTILTPGRVVGVDVGAAGPRVDGIAVTRGRGLRPGDRTAGVAVLEANYAKYHRLPAAGRLRLAGGGELRYVGQGRSPEYFLVTAPGGGDFGGAESSYAVVFAPLATAQRVTGRPGAVNDLVLTLRPGADVSRVRAELTRALAGQSPRLGFAVTRLSDEPAHRVLYKDAEGDQQVFDIFAVLILAGAAFASFNLATRIVEAQRREIGIGMALGVPTSELAIRPLLLGAQIALGGVVMGIGLGIACGELFRGVLEDLLPLPVIRTPFELDVFLRGALLGLLLPIAATAIPVWRAVRVRPIEAIRVGFRAAKGSGLVPALRRLSLPGGSLAQLPLRNLLRAPRRTLTTLLGVAAVITVVVALLGMIDSFLATTDRSAAETRGDHPARMVVDLDGFHARDSRVVRGAAAAPGVGAAEPILTVPARLATRRASFPVRVTLLDPRSRLWHPTAVEGRLAPGRPGIMLARKAAADLGVAVGGQVTLRHPQAVGPGEFREVATRVRVVALHPNPFRIFAYMDAGQARALGLAGQANGLYVLPAAGASESAVKRALFALPGVASVQRATATTDLVRDRMDDFVGVLRVTEFFALVLALLIAFNSSAINADERQREHATMFAFGVPVRRALLVALVESLSIGVLGTLAGVGLGLAVLGWVVNGIFPDTFPDLEAIVSLSAGSLAVAAVVGVAAAGLAPLLTLRRLRRMDTPSTLRVVE